MHTKTDPEEKATASKIRGLQNEDGYTISIGIAPVIPDESVNGTTTIAATSSQTY